jgi:DNA (cytosine-5)-methyltransferase 1
MTNYYLYRKAEKRGKLTQAEETELIEIARESVKRDTARFLVRWTPRKPRLLDLFCGAGGAGQGYAHAGFEVVGVDIAPQPRYPFEFHQGDALDFVREHGREFDVIHASPPCQGYSVCRFLPQNAGNVYALLIDAIRDELRSSGKPYVIENVVGAPLETPIVLEGRMFGLKVLRKRLFESSLFLLSPMIAPMKKRKHVADISEFERGQYGFVGVYGQRFSVPVAREAMGIDWMTRAELAQAIPPAYTEFIGREMLRILTTEKIYP